MPRKIDVRRLGLLVRRKRERDNITLKDVADQTGLKVPTISRVERAEPEDLEGSTFLTLCKWLPAILTISARKGISPIHLLKTKLPITRLMLSNST